MFAGGAVSKAIINIQRNCGEEMLIIGLERRWENR
jgi:hypothetical protein